MKNLLPVWFAALAAIGNALFALGQKHSEGGRNGVLFVSASAAVAVLFTLALAPLAGPFALRETLRIQGKFIVLSGAGLALTYLGFNLLYSRYGVASYALYAVLSIVTTTLIAGIIWLKEPVNSYQWAAIMLAIVAVVLFSIGRAKG